MIHVGDCLDVMRTLQPDSVDAIVTDPPYHLTNPGGGGPHGKGLATPYARARAGASATGFMGKAWDGGDVAFRPETWAEALRVAKPGAHLAAFGGTRTFHRLVCAIEDAGWEIRDTLMWVYGSGFPKSKNLDGEWAGWGSALKPAWEPICLARKPLSEKNLAANVARWRTGALNIDACRVPGEKPDTTGLRGGIPCRHDERTPRPARGRAGEASATRRYTDAGGTNFAATPGPRGGDEAGRWPANLVHDGSAEVVAQFPREAGASAPVRGTEASELIANAYGARERVPGAFHADTGSAARFFYCAKASPEDRNDGLVGQTNTHPTVKPTELMRWLCRLVTPPGGKVLDPFSGSGSTGRGAIAQGFRFVGIELDPDYAAIAEVRICAVQPGLSLGSAA